jgi:ketosteroid isomerase-like protein
VRRQGAPVVHKSGYTLTIMRKQPDGRWVLARDANLLAAKE